MTHMYLPMEIFNREYWGKLALASQLVELGHPVTIGQNLAVREEAIHCTEPSVFYEIKGKLSRSMEHLDLLRHRGVKLVGQDEEAGISYSKFADFKKWRPEVEGVGYFDSFFAWGLEDYQEFLKFSSAETIFRTGSPRTLFWGEFGEKIFNKEIEEIRKQHGKYILIITNSTSRNPIVSKRQTKGMMKEMNYDSAYFKLLKVRESWEEEAHLKTVQAIQKILDESDFNILVRPHPVEDERVWRNLFEGNRRVFVNKTGAGSPVVLGAKGVVHAGSTLGLESLFQGKPTVSLHRLIRAEESPMSANELSISITSLNQLVPALLSGANGDIAKSRMENLVTRWSDPAVLKLQSGIMLQPIKMKKESLNLTEQKIKKTPSFSRGIKRLRYGKSPTQSLNTNKRPYIHLNKITQDFQNLQKCLNFQREVSIFQIAESTFRIAPKI